MPTDAGPVRVVIAGLADGGAADGSAADGSAADGGAAETVARALRDAGVEVVYAGLVRTVDQLVRTVIQEDADAIGIAPVDAAAPIESVGQVRAMLNASGADDIEVFAATDPELSLGWLRDRDSRSSDA